MSIDIKIKDKLNFTGIDLTAPETVVEECVKEISNATNEMVLQDLINATIIANSRETDQVSDCIDDNT